MVNEGEDSVVVAGGANGIWEGPRGGSPDFSTIKLRARVDLSTWKASSTLVKCSSMKS